MHSYASCWFFESHTVVTKICDGNHASGYMSEMYDCPVFTVSNSNTSHIT